MANTDRGANTRIPRPMRCDSCAPGHDVHWIQARRCLDQPGRPVVLLDVADDGVLTAGCDGATQTLWHHDAIRLRAAAANAGDRVELRLAYGVLAVPSEHGSYLFSVANLDDAYPCPAPGVVLPNERDLFRLLGDHE